MKSKVIENLKSSLRKRSKKSKQKEYVTSISFDCDGKFLTHKWDGRVNVPVSEDLMSRTCTRCGKKYADLYAERKQKILDKYRASVGKLNEKSI